MRTKTDKKVIPPDLMHLSEGQLRAMKLWDALPDVAAAEPVKGSRRKVDSAAPAPAPVAEN